MPIRGDGQSSWRRSGTRVELPRRRPPGVTHGVRYDRGAKDTSITVGLLADPDLPADLAEELARDLPGVLAERVRAGVSWTS